jgi:hypothetical protein
LLGVAITFGLGRLSWRAMRRWVERRPAAERAWAESRPYQLTGYPALLETRPKRPNWGQDGHTTLDVALRFSGEPPANLAAILRGFDEELSGTEVRFHRPSPYDTVTTRRNRTVNVLDTNTNVRSWVHRFDRVLTSLHDAHGLEWVRLSLR